MKRVGSRAGVVKRRGVMAATMSLQRSLLVLAGFISMSVVAAEVPIATPPIAVGFQSASSEEIRPADATGAASETYILAGSNAGVRIHTRDGNVVSEQTLSQFWGTTIEVHDPRIAYDVAAKRWVAAAVRGYDALLISVSASDDPTGAWLHHEIGLPIDRIRMALTRDTIMIAKETSAGQLVLSLSKAELYAGIANPAVRQSEVEVDAMPVHAPESAIEYVVSVRNSQIRVRRLDRLHESYRAFDGGFGWKLPLENDAPMAGVKNRLVLDDGDVQAAVFRDGWIYAVHRIGTSMRTADDNALMWWKVDPEGAQAPEAGIIDSPAGTTYAFPSLAVNRKGGMLISFCTFSKTAYPSAAFVYRNPEGGISVPAVIRAGETPVSNISDMWGKYTTVVEDPNGRDFWTGQIYATRQSWATWWANVTIAAPRGRSVRH
jgi:hypothetical protein